MGNTQKLTETGNETILGGAVYIRVFNNEWAAPLDIIASKQRRWMKTQQQKDAQIGIQEHLKVVN